MTKRHVHYTDWFASGDQVTFAECEQGRPHTEYERVTCIECLRREHARLMASLHAIHNRMEMLGQ